MKKGILIGLFLILFITTGLMAEMYASVGLADGLHIVNYKDEGDGFTLSRSLLYLGYGGLNSQFGIITDKGIGFGLNISSVYIGEMTYSWELDAGMLSDSDSERITASDWNGIRTMGSFSPLFVYAPLWNNTMFLKIAAGPSFSYIQTDDINTGDDTIYSYLGAITAVDFGLFLNRIIYLNFGLSVGYTYLAFDNDWDVIDTYTWGLEVYTTAGIGFRF